MLKAGPPFQPSDLFGEHKTARILTAGNCWGQQRKYPVISRSFQSLSGLEEIQTNVCIGPNQAAIYNAAARLGQGYDPALHYLKNN